MTQTTTIGKILALLLVAINCFLICQAASSSKKENNSALLEDMKALDPCVVASVFAFINPLAPLPTTITELKRSCASHNEAYKCVKEKSKKSPALVRRGLVSLVNNMGRMTKKYCSNPQSELSKRFVSDFKCVKEKHLDNYVALEIEFANAMYEIHRQSYNDSVVELKYICCTLYKYRRDFLNGFKSCPASKATMEELISNIVANDVSLLCDDEEQLLTKVCPNLRPMKLAKSLDPVSKNIGTSGIALYLVATLGEPE